jgi:CRP-like cAMP-binding protein
MMQTVVTARNDGPEDRDDALSYFQEDRRLTVAAVVAGSGGCRGRVARNRLRGEVLPERVHRGGPSSSVHGSSSATVAEDCAGGRCDRDWKARGRSGSNASVRRVVAAFAVITLAEWVFGTTVAVRAFGVGGALAVGLVGFRFAPAALAGVWTTRFADRARRDRVLSLTAAGRAGATVVAAIALAVHLPFAVVIALVWCDAAIGSGYRPAQAALLPGLVRAPGELTAATGLVSNVKTSGQLVGALLGGLLVAGLPVALPVTIAAVLYCSGMALTARLPGGRRFVVATRGLRGVRAGVGVLRRGREARVIVGFACLRSMMRGLWLALAVVTSLQLLSLGRSGVGVLMAAAAVGALGAMGVTRRLVGNRRLATWFALGLVLCGLPIAAVGLASGPAPAVILIMVWGAGMGLSDVGAQTLLNRIVQADSIGPVTGAMECGKLLFEGLGSLVGPLLLVAFGARGALFVAGGAVPIVVVLAHGSFARLDDRAVARQDVLDLLRGVVLFSPLPLDALEGVAARLQTERYQSGAEIVRQGEAGEHRWYLVHEGDLGVEVDGFLVNQLTRGSQFGERALLRSVPRSATVRAVTDVVLHGLDGDDFLAAVAGVDLHDPEPVSPAPTPLLDPATALAQAPLVHSLGPAAVSELIDRSRIQHVDAETAIVTSGEREDAYHVLLGGRAHVYVDGHCRQELLPGDAFGEIAVLHQIPRTASVIAHEHSTVLTVAGDTLRAAVHHHASGPLAALAA